MNIVNTSYVDRLGIFMVLGQKIFKFLVKLALWFASDHWWFNGIVQKDLFLFSDVFKNDDFSFFKIEFREISQLIRPKVDLYCFKFISDYNPNDLFLLLLISDLLDSIIGLFFNIFDNSNDIHHLIFNVIILMFPMKILFRIILSYLGLVKQVKSVISVSEFDIWSSFDLN